MLVQHQPVYCAATDPSALGWKPRAELWKLQLCRSERLGAVSQRRDDDARQGEGIVVTDRRPRQMLVLQLLGNAMYRYLWAEST